MSVTSSVADSTTNPFARSQNLYIGGAWRPATGGATIPVLNPSTEALLARVPDATQEDAAAAVEAAAKAAAVWAATAPRHRSEI